MLDVPFINKELRPQASFVPPSTSAGTTLVVPKASRKAVSGRQNIVGGTVSKISTDTWQEAVRPTESVTVNVITAEGTLAQVTVAGLTERDKMPQASLLPLSIKVTGTVAEPVTPRYTV